MYRGKTVVRVISEVKSALEMVKRKGQEWGPVPSRWWCRSVCRRSALVIADFRLFLGWSFFEVGLRC